MLRCMLGSVKGVKSENPKGKGKLGNEKGGMLTNLARNIKESIYIRVNNPTLNNNTGKFNLSHILDRVLLNTRGLTLNNQSNNNNNQLTNPH